jgi:hypothetical protein
MPTPYPDFSENNITLSNLEVNFIDQEDYEMIHENTIIVCHDVLIKYNLNNITGYLLVERLKQPALGEYWPVGGRILRGVPTEESLRRKAHDECNLTLENITYIESARTLFKDNPFGHARGTDTLNLIFIADGRGDLQLNNLHNDPILVTQETYQTIKPTLAPYVQHCFEYIEKNNLW